MTSASRRPRRVITAVAVAIVTAGAFLCLSIAPAQAKLVGDGGSTASRAPATISAAKTPTYTVRSGDWLARIAGARCGSVADWSALYRGNRATIGANPNLIQPGQVLRLTCSGAPVAQPKPKKTTPPTKGTPGRTASGWTNPLPGNTCSSGFGWRWGAMHEGIDLVKPYGTPIRAAAAGVVKMARVPGGNHYGNGYGEETAIYHGGGVWTHYGHQSRIIVRVGQHVAAGQVIGYVGHTGDVVAVHSDGSHLHFEVETGNTSGAFRYGAQRNPATWLRAHGVRVGC